MGLYSASLVLDRVHANRCLTGNESLLVGEYIYCRRCLPSIYGGKLSTVDKKKSGELISSLLEENKAIRETMRDSQLARQRLQSFFALLLANGGESLEAFVHAYMFLFWEHLAFLGAIAGHPRGQLFWMAKSPPTGTAYKEVGGTAGSVIERLSQEGVQIDLAAVDPQAETLWLLEIKRDDLDDRAVGQMLRYFDRAVRCLPSREFRALDINHVRPVIVLESVDPRLWRSIPLHFRELLEIYAFGKPGGVDNPLRLARVRRQLLSGVG
uniref:Uncharacterized protein n=1 Tax=Burkholderia sp. (strain CCGE1003) TaxID=640512 RepID=E1T3W6_BURSG